MGTQVDLRDDSNTVEKLAKNKQRPISPESGEKLAKDLRAVKFVECSALTQVKRAAAHTRDDKKALLTYHPHDPLQITFYDLFLTERPEECIRRGNTRCPWTSRDQTQEALRPFVGTQAVGDALTPTREAEKKKHSGGVFFIFNLIGLGVWSGESYNWEKLWEQNSKKTWYWRNWQHKWYCKQINAHCAFLNVSRTTEEIREPWNQ